MAGRLLPACQGTDEQVLLGLHQGYCLATGLAMCVRNGAALQDRSLKGGWLVGWVCVCVWWGGVLVCVLGLCTRAVY